MDGGAHNPRMNLKILGGAGLCLFLPVAVADASEQWDWTLESGYLWGLGHNTDGDYELAPLMFTLRTPATMTLGEGWVVRTRVSALFAGMVSGPEDYYAGLLAAPSLERGFADGTGAWFFSIGGGAGLTNSTGGTGGLGHDFTLNWFAQGGLRQRLTDSLDWQASVFFIHLSNGGRTNPNAGVDALGFTLGVTKRF